MKRTCMLIAFAATAVLAHAGGVYVPKAIQKIYDQQTKDFAKGDFKAFFAPYDSAFVYTEADGKKKDLAGTKAEIMGVVKGSTRRSITMNPTWVKKTRDTVVVRYIAHISFTTNGKTTRLREDGIDTWKKTAAGWKEVSTVDKAFAPEKTHAPR